MLKKMSRNLMLILVGVSMISVSCTISANEESEVVSGLPTPTTHPLFKSILDATPIEVPESPTPDLSITRISSDTISEEAAATREAYLQALTGYSSSDLVMRTVYSDALDANWVLLESEGMEVDLESEEYVHNGRYSIAMTPLDAWQRMYFGVAENAEESYPQNDVISISFWLNGGNDYIELDDLAFTFVGSNDYSYWVPDDKSAYFDDEFPFSETTLVWLDLNKSIPPETWVEIEVFVHERIFDPAYRNITGFYLKNADDFFNTVYVDDITIKRFPDPNLDITTGDVGNNEADEPLTTVVPEVSIELTPILTPTAGIATETPASESITDSIDCVISPLFGWELYTVKAGDTISGLAQLNNITVETLMEVNCLPDNVISVNQKIWLPSSTTTADDITLTPIQTPILTSTLEIAPQIPTPVDTVSP